MSISFIVSLQGSCFLLKTLFIEGELSIATIELTYGAICSSKSPVPEPKSAICQDFLKFISSKILLAIFTTLSTLLCSFS
jgi:hypothetical protein